VWRKLILGKGDKEEQEKGIGERVLVVQGSSEASGAKLLVPSSWCKAEVPQVVLVVQVS